MNKERIAVFPDRWIEDDILYHIWDELNDADSVDRIYDIMSKLIEEWMSTLKPGEELVFSKGLTDWDDQRLSVVTKRLENDKEYETRIAREEKVALREANAKKSAKLSKMEKERKEYERLKKKFEK